MIEKKTIREWLNELPEPISSRAIKNAENESESSLEEEDVTSSIMCALAGAFVWNDTPEGHEFWRQVSKGEISELPEHLKEEE